ncbi:hypothetical protein ACFLIM_34195 [Nonomuraea sp. M3C6]|uniref:D-alanyl-D-alanine carboxypeptidase n=1 Tax=Nonomuraea marmarensis TaxID=3351344 RepID=A0ABW7ALN1_9ACTN
MRLIVVALLGIEITIIALASAASAAPHPDGEQEPSSLHQARFPGWQYAPEHMRRAAKDLNDTFGVRPGMVPFMAIEQFMDASREWPTVDLEPIRRSPSASLYDDTVRERPATNQPPRVARKQPRPRSAVTKSTRSPLRTGVAAMPKMRPHLAQRRAQVDLTRVMPRQAAVQMSHAIATGWLKSAGLRTKSTGHCTSRHMHHCTSLDSVRTGTIARVIELKRDSGCPIMVTGGTEEGHAPGHFSHGNGYKLDITHNACIDRHITKNQDKAGVRSDGAPLYRSKAGTTFADESDHWDILFR